MENFIAYNPTKIFFGSNALNKLSKNVLKLGKKALILFGKNSAKKYGYIQKIEKFLEEAGIGYCEFGGIKPNPIVEDVEVAVEFCKKNNIEFIIGIGGGSVIDSAKIIALAYSNSADPWEIMTEKFICSKCIPIVAVLTMSATGTEMNPFAVIQNHKTHEKIGFYSEFIFPTQSYLDPSLTLTVPKDQTAYGIADIVAHSLEAYFACGYANLSDQLVGGLLREVFEVAPLLMKNLDKYEYRARIMWASTIALNGTLYGGRKSSGDWGVHSIGHVVSYLFDTPHGATLSIAFPAWMKQLKPQISERLEKLGFLITGKKTSADGTISLFEKFFKSIGCPIRLEEIEICVADLPNIKQYIIHTNANGMCWELKEDDINGILNFML